MTVPRRLWNKRSLAPEAASLRGLLYESMLGSAQTRQGFA